MIYTNTKSEYTQENSIPSCTYEVLQTADVNNIEHVVKVVLRHMLAPSYEHPFVGLHDIFLLSSLSSQRIMPVDMHDAYSRDHLHDGKTPTVEVHSVVLYISGQE